MIGETRELVEKDRRYVWHALSGYDPDASRMVVAKGDGAWITDTDGNRYLDGMSGLWCVNVGYGREELAQAAYDQLKTLPYYPLLKSHEPAIRLGEKLGEWLEDDYVFLFSNSGSEANEVAFKVARQYHEQNGGPGRYKFVSRYRAFHGQTMGALAATGQAQRKYKYEPLVPGFLHVQPPDRYRCHYCSEKDACNLECAREIERAMTWELPETVAGVIMEPIITGGGIIVPHDDYMRTVEDICEKSGALLIVDEVICGFGRTGKRFGYQHYSVKPDIVTMAKGVTSAYFPLAITAVKREVYETFAGDEEYGRLRHINTFGGHPGGCAVALKNLQIMEEEDLPGRSAARGEHLREALTRLDDHPYVGDVRGKGLLFGIELVENKESKLPASVEKVAAVISGCQERGLIISKNADTVAGYNNVLTLSPPLIIGEDEVEFIARTLKESIYSV
jgi:taurine-pyruvate aminotransferase